MRGYVQEDSEVEDLTDSKISQEIIDRTTRCDRDYSCLSESTRDLCEVTHANGENVLFIERNPRPCPYKIPFGSSYICTCPTRHELYKKYHI